MSRPPRDLFSSAIFEAVPASEVMTTEQAAAFLGCSTQFLEIARHKGGGPPYCKLGVRLVRYRRVALLEFLAKREVTSTSQEIPTEI